MEIQIPNPPQRTMSAHACEAATAAEHVPDASASSSRARFPVISALSEKEGRRGALVSGAKSEAIVQGSKAGVGTGKVVAALLTKASGSNDMLRNELVERTYEIRSLEIWEFKDY